MGAAFVHPDDEYNYRVHNAHAKPVHKIERGIAPLPYLGNPQTARVILLAKNASYTEQDETEADNLPALNLENEKALLFESDYPFFYLDPRFEGTTGYIWWNQILGSLINAAMQAAAVQRLPLTRKDIVGRIACLQSHPYRSRDSFDPAEPFPSQAFTDHLAQEAVARPGVVFVVMGGAARWQLAVPELSKAEIIPLKTQRKPYITLGNMKAENFIRLVSVLIGS